MEFFHRLLEKFDWMIAGLWGLGRDPVAQGRPDRP